MRKIDNLQKKNQKQKQQQMHYSSNKNLKVKILKLGFLAVCVHIKPYKTEETERFRYNYFEEKLYVRFDEKLKKIYMPSKYVKFPNLGHY